MVKILFTLLKGNCQKNKNSKENTRIIQYIGWSSLLPSKVFDFKNESITYPELPAQEAEASEKQEDTTHHLQIFSEIIQ